MDYILTILPFIPVAALSVFGAICFVKIFLLEDGKIHIEEKPDKELWQFEIESDQLKWKKKKFVIFQIDRVENSGYNEEVNKND